MLNKDKLLKFDLEKDIFERINSAKFHELFIILNEIKGTHKFIIDLPSYPTIPDTIYREELIRAVGSTQSIEGNELTEEEIEKAFQKAGKGESLLIAEEEVVKSKLLRL